MRKSLFLRYCTLAVLFFFVASAQAALVDPNRAAKRKAQKRGSMFSRRAGAKAAPKATEVAPAAKPAAQPAPTDQALPPKKKY